MQPANWFQGVDQINFNITETGNEKFGIFQREVLVLNCFLFNAEGVCFNTHLSDRLSSSVSDCTDYRGKQRNILRCQNEFKRNWSFLMISFVKASNYKRRSVYIKFRQDWFIFTLFFAQSSLSLRQKRLFTQPRRKYFNENALIVFFATVCKHFSDENFITYLKTATHDKLELRLCFSFTSWWTYYCRHTSRMKTLYPDQLNSNLTIFDTYFVHWTVYTFTCKLMHLCILFVISLLGFEREEFQQSDPRWSNSNPLITRQYCRTTNLSIKEGDNRFSFGCVASDSQLRILSRKK